MEGALLNQPTSRTTLNTHNTHQPGGKTGGADTGSQMTNLTA